MAVSYPMKEDSDLTGCTVQLNGNFFNLGALVGNDQDYQVTYVRAVAGGVANATETVLISFNFCEETNKVCDNEESNEGDFANMAVLTADSG